MGVLDKKLRDAINGLFVGDYVFTETELEIIYKDTSKVFNTILSERGTASYEVYDNLIFVAVVNAVKNWDSDSETLFDYIGRFFLGSKVIPPKIYNHITNVIKRLEANGKIVALNCFKKKYYATLLCHALATIKSSESFFDLCWKIYCEDLNQFYSKGDDAFGQLSVQLKNKFAKDSETSENFNLGSQVYYLRAGIKGLAIDHPELMTSFVDRSIGLIDKVFNNQLVEKEKYYLDRLIVDWWNRKESSLGVEIQKRGTLKERVVSDYRFIKPKYAIVDGSIVLELAPFRLQGNFDISPYLTVYEGAKRVASFELKTKGSGLLMATKRFSVSLDDLEIDSLNLMVEICHGQKIIYSSKKDLSRSFLLFKDAREVCAQNCNPGNYHLYTFDFNGLTQYPDEIHRIQGRHFVFSAFAGEILQNEEKTVFFENSLVKREIWLHANKRADIVYRFEGNDYEVFDGEVFVVASPETNIANYGVRFGVTQFPLKDFAKERRTEGVYIPITEIINPGEPQSISIFKYGSNQIISTISVVKFLDIKLEYDDIAYYDNLSFGKVSFTTKYFKSSATFSIDDQEVLLPVSNGDIVVAPPIITWAIDNGERHNKYYENGYWYEEMGNSSILSIDIPSRFSGQLILSTGSVVMKDSECSFQIGQTIHALKESQKEPIEILYRLDTPTTKKLIPITRVYFQESFNIPPVFIFAQHQLVWNPRNGFIGPSNAKFKVSILGDNNQKYVCDVGLRPQTFRLNGIEEGYYKLQVDYKDSCFFGNGKTLYKKEICIGNEKNIQFKNIVLTVNKVKINGVSSLVDIKPFYIENIRYADNRNGFDFYTGTIFIDTWKSGKTLLNKLPNDEGGFDFINPVRIEMKDKSSCWIVYGLDDEDDIDSFFSEFSYDQGKNQISASDRNTKGIMYFKFEKGKVNV